MTIGFIGAGAMARAIAKGIVHAGLAPANALLASTRSEASGRPFVEALPGARWTADNAEVLRSSDLTVLGVKPQVLADVAPTLRDASAGKLILSIAAGVTLGKLQGWLHPTARIIRSMPNTPMQIGYGASVYCGAGNATEADLALAESVLAAGGKAWRVTEDKIDAVNALSGSGPAYVFHFIEALIRGGVALGLSDELAHALAVQTVLGSAILASQSSLDPMALAAQVKSPKGTTLAACAVLEEDDALNVLIARCLAAARNRAEELARGEKG
jgi:pyrroline-5-carboxylate reductase